MSTYYVDIICRHLSNGKLFTKMSTYQVHINITNMISISTTVLHSSKMILFGYICLLITEILHKHLICLCIFLYFLEHLQRANQIISACIRQSGGGRYNQMPPSSPRLRGKRTNITISVKDLLKSCSDGIFSEIPVGATYRQG